MPLSALFLLMMGAGGFLVYTAVKGANGPAGGHPYTAFTNVLNGKGSLSSPTTTVTPGSNVAGFNSAGNPNAATRTDVPQ